MDYADNDDLMISAIIVSGREFMVMISNNDR